jgi:hypothetical protein
MTSNHEISGLSKNLVLHYLLEERKEGGENGSNYPGHSQI